MKFNVNDDIIYQIEMELFQRYNSHIASIYDHLGEAYSYQDLKDVEQAELEENKNLLEEAVKQLQRDLRQENRLVRNLINYIENWRDDISDQKDYSNEDTATLCALNKILNKYEDMRGGKYEGN